ncbi:hypothetical protein X975_02043, partial [Stegodyphus mimosarum]
MCSLVEFVCLVMEKYYMKRMLEFANHRITKPLCMAYKLQTKAKDLDVHPIDENMYYVSSSENERTFYTVLQDMEMCDCAIGTQGKFCKHLWAVHMKLNINFRNLPKLLPKDFEEIAYLAMGYTKPEFFKSMKKSSIPDSDDASLPENVNLQNSQADKFKITEGNASKQTQDLSSAERKHSTFSSEIKKLNANFSRLAEIANENDSEVIRKNSMWEECED